MLKMDSDSLFFSVATAFHAMQAVSGAVELMTLPKPYLSELEITISQKTYTTSFFISRT